MLRLLQLRLNNKHLMLQQRYRYRLSASRTLAFWRDHCYKQRVDFSTAIQILDSYQEATNIRVVFKEQQELYENQLI